MPKYVDEDGRVRWTYVCYVVELDPAACLSRRAPCGGRCGTTPVYVGQTALTAADRFAQHKAGGPKASRWVRDYGLHLRPRLARRVGELPTKTAALQAEAELGEYLRHKGYCVYGAH